MNGLDPEQIATAAFVEPNVDKNGFLDRERLFDILNPVFQGIAVVITQEDIRDELRTIETESEKTLTRSEFIELVTKLRDSV